MTSPSNAAPGTALAGDHHSVAAAWADADHDGRPDLYVNTFLSGEVEARDYLFRNGPDGFTDVTPAVMVTRGSSHGVAWADFDGDGDPDLAMANNHAEGAHPLYRNGLDAERRGRGLTLVVVDAEGRHTRPGATVIVRRAGDGFTTARLVDAGGGYSSQGAAPVHVALPAGNGPVDVEVVWFEDGARRTHRLTGIPLTGNAPSRVLIRAVAR